jgi:hypothetical protein
MLATISPLLAQDGRVRVVVSDMYGSTAQGVDVTVGDRRLKTDEAGVVSAGGLTEGRIDVTATSPGFKPWRGIFRVSNGVELKVDARLELGYVRDGVSVAPARTGRLVVSVRDGTKAALISAEVQVKCSDGSLRTARVNGDGVATLSSLTAGNVEVEVWAPQFKTWQGSALLAKGGEVKLAARMEVSDPGTKVEVKPSVGRRFVDWLTSCARR